MYGQKHTKKCSHIDLASDGHFNEVKRFINKFSQKLSLKNEGETTLTIVDKLNGCVDQENQLDFDYKVFV